MGALSPKRELKGFWVEGFSFITGADRRPPPAQAPLIRLWGLGFRV